MTFDISDSTLQRINQRHAVIRNLGTKCVVFDEKRRNFQSTADFAKGYINPVQVGTKDGKPVTMPEGEWWLKQTGRRQYDYVGFYPEGIDDPLCLNMWRDFTVTPKQGDWRRFQEHITDIICDGNGELARYWLDWMADAVQNPGDPGESALVMTGDPGLGKGFFAREFGALWVPHFLHVTNQNQITGRFNAHLMDKSVLFADECFNSKNSQHHATLKTLVTEPEITYEGKFVNAEGGRNRLHIIVASNNEHVLPVEDRDRRYCVTDVRPHANRKAHFGPIKQQMLNGGRAAMLFDLLRRDISAYEPYRIPFTKARQRHRQASMPAHMQVLRDLLWSGALPSAFHKNPAKVCNDNLYAFMRETAPELRNSSNEELGHMVRKWEAVEREFPSQGRRYKVFKPLREIHNRWADLFGSDESLPAEWLGQSREGQP